MKYSIIVLVKQVPDTQNVTGEAMNEDGTIKRSALPAIFNPEDLHALEAALTVKDQFPESRIHVITMGPPAAATVLKESLFRGADDVTLISDRKFAAADTLATSYALSMAIKKIGDFDLVFAGRQAIDGDTAQVGPQTAEKLGINQMTCVSDIEKIEKKSLTVRRSIEGGFEIVKSAMPCLLTMTDENYYPRPPSVKQVMANKNVALKSDEKYDESYIESAEKLGKKAVIDVWDIEAINADPQKCGLSGSPTKVKKIDSVVLTASETKMIQPDEAGINSMMHELIQEHTLG